MRNYRIDKISITKDVYGNDVHTRCDDYPDLYVLTLVEHAAGSVTATPVAYTDNPFIGDLLTTITNYDELTPWKETEVKPSTS